jgi:2-polyprenyl-3-methyl-5-hydroxy-6-metoxy-1,4-benzoquinol methylase
MVEMVAVDCCPVCGGEGRFDLANLDRELNIELRMHSCKRCNSSYHNPRMSSAAMAEYYSSGKYRSLECRTIDEKRTTKRTQQTVRLIGNNARGKPRRCLDVGCSRGYLLRALEKKFGAEIVGYDIYHDPQAVIDVVDSKDKIQGKFDLITCIHVLEHVPEPMVELEWMASLLADDGMLMIEIPLVRVVTPPHPVIFSRESVPIMMKRINAEYIFIDMQIAKIGIIMAWKMATE